jgi:mRNA interferase HigB
MKIFGLKIAEAFCRRHTDARSWVENWIADAKVASWKMPQDIKASYSSASFLAGNVVIFNVKGNSYRFETVVAYQIGVVALTWAGTHAGYDTRYRKRRRRN